ncbi:MAG: transposase, partial [Chloroflexi bacterium]|nr:transposase [Chloroflexota bacterium]
MGIIHDAQAFVQSLLAPLKRRRCPRCGSPLLKKNGTYTRTLRDLGGIRQIRVQRCRCCDCGHTFSEQRPEIAPHRWYTRRVQRKYLDLYVT